MYRAHTLEPPNKYSAQFKRDLDDMHLAQRINRAKASVDNAPPEPATHLDTRAKQNQLKKERLTQIDRENQILIERMQRQFTRGGCVDDHLIQKGPISLNKVRRENELRVITAENRRLNNAITNQQPQIVAARLEADYQRNRKDYMRLCVNPVVLDKQEPKVSNTQKGNKNETRPRPEEQPADKLPSASQDDLKQSDLQQSGLQQGGDNNSGNNGNSSGQQNNSTNNSQTEQPKKDQSQPKDEAQLKNEQSQLSLKGQIANSLGEKKTQQKEEPQVEEQAPAQQTDKDQQQIPKSSLKDQISGVLAAQDDGYEGRDVYVTQK